MTPRGSDSKDDSALGVRTLGIGALVRIQSGAGEIWSANVTSVSDRLIGLRGWTPVEGTFRERDTVTLMIGHDDRLISANARVLATAGTLLRIVRRDASDEMDRRRAPRLRVDLTATVTPTRGAAERDAFDGDPFEADVVDLSTSGCAIRCVRSLAVGATVGIAMDLAGTAAVFTGEVMRTWTGDHPPATHAGIRFDLVPPATTAVVNRFLVNQLQSGLPTR